MTCSTQEQCNLAEYSWDMNMHCATVVIFQMYSAHQREETDLRHAWKWGRDTENKPSDRVLAGDNHQWHADEPSTDAASGIHSATVQSTLNTLHTAIYHHHHHQLHNHHHHHYRFLFNMLIFLKLIYKAVFTGKWSSLMPNEQHQDT